jgi:hypothetical protein
VVGVAVVAAVDEPGAPLGIELFLVAPPQPEAARTAAASRAAQARAMDGARRIRR